MGSQTLQSILISMSVLSCVLSLEILHTFRDPEDNIFQQLALDSLTGTVYVGATNRLHRLSANLSLLQSAATGPRDDNPDCPPPILPCDKGRSPQNSYTVGMVVDPTHGTLILCTTLFHGSCQTLKLGNITSVISYAQKPIVPNDNTSCVMFLVEGPENQTSIYIGAEYSTLGDVAYRDLIPSISSRDLQTLELAYRDKEGGTKMSIKQELRSTFKVKFIAGFSYKGFAYFITTQPRFPRSQERVTRISRLCQKDRYFRSYVEIPLECQDGSSATAVVAHAASVLDENGLLVSFSADSSSGPESSSLCFYRIADIDKVFAETVQNCYNGQGKVGPAHYETPRTCMRTVGRLFIIIIVVVVMVVVRVLQWIVNCIHGTCL